MGEFLTTVNAALAALGPVRTAGPGLFPGHQTFGEEGSRNAIQSWSRVLRSGADRPLRSLRASYRVPRMAPASYQEPVKD
jgi:hypothetical protein